MRRFVLLAFLLVCFIPVSVSITGCARNKNTAVFCNGGDSGIQTGQVTTIDLEPKLTGVSLSNGQMASVGAASATDCKGTTVSVTAFTYATSDPTHTLVDINPTTGQLCGGSWNRNTPGGVADFTFCNNTGKTGTATVTASGNGATSNPVPVYVHPIIESVALDTSSQSGCVSQGSAITLNAQAFDTNGTLIPSNIVGHLTFAPQSTSVVTIDENGVATAQSPGSTLITASVSSATSTAGYFYTCPPTSIQLNATGASSSNIVINPNTTQPITATVLDKNGTILTNLSLTYVSTSPTTIPATSGSVTPVFTGAAAITAFCQPPTCNPSPPDHIGLFGNGKPIASNTLDVTSGGVSGTLLYLGSTQSQYLASIDLTAGTTGNSLRLPYVPNSMVLSTDGTTLYLGSSTELMVVNTLNGTLSREDQSVSGNVVSVSPNNATAIITDPVRKIIYLYGQVIASTTTTGATGTTSTGSSSSGGSGTSTGPTATINSTFGGVATHAAWSPDSTTVYITTSDNQLITHSDQNGWQVISSTGLTTVNDVAVTVPAVGAYFAGSTGLEGHTYCHQTIYSASATPSVTSISYYPTAMGQAASVAAPAQHIAATNDGAHILGANVASGVPQITDLGVTLPDNDCPTASGAVPTFTQKSLNTYPATGASAGAITGVFPSQDSSIAFVTYTPGTSASPTLPSYTPSNSTVTNIPLVTTGGSAAPTAPINGVFASNGTVFYASTAGDNQVHLITKQSSGAFTDASQINPKLPVLTGTGFAAPDLIAQYPRSFR